MTDQQLFDQLFAVADRLPPADWPLDRLLDLAARHPHHQPLRALIARAAVASSDRRRDELIRRAKLYAAFPDHLFDYAYGLPAEPSREPVYQPLRSDEQPQNTPTEVSTETDSQGNQAVGDEQRPLLETANAVEPEPEVEHEHARSEPVAADEKEEPLVQEPLTVGDLTPESPLETVDHSTFVPLSDESVALPEIEANDQQLVNEPEPTTDPDKEEKTPTILKSRLSRNYRPEPKQSFTRINRLPLNRGLEPLPRRKKPADADEQLSREVRRELDALRPKPTPRAIDLDAISAPEGEDVARSVLADLQSIRSEGEQSKPVTNQPIISHDGDFSVERFQRFIDEVKQKKARLEDEMQRGESTETNGSENRELAERSNQLSATMPTETMARLLEKQGNRREAIAIYEALTLKNPEKKAFFAREINRLRRR